MLVVKMTGVLIKEDMVMPRGDVHMKWRQRLEQCVYKPGLLATASCGRG